jgi:hypothetical protein
MTRFSQVAGIGANTRRGPTTLAGHDRHHQEAVVGGAVVDGTVVRPDSVDGGVAGAAVVGTAAPGTRGGVVAVGGCPPEGVGAARGASPPWLEIELAGSAIAADTGPFEPPLGATARAGSGRDDRTLDHDIAGHWRDREIGGHWSADRHCLDRRWGLLSGWLRRLRQLHDGVCSQHREIEGQTDEDHQATETPGTPVREARQKR